MCKEKQKIGFTLIELIVVIAIIAILAFIAVPRIFTLIERSNKSTDISNLKILNTVTGVAAATHGNPDNFFIWFTGIGYSERWDYLIEDQGLLAEVIYPKRSNHSFVWSGEHRLWLYGDQDGNLYYFSLNGNSFISIDDIDNFRLRHNNRGWEITAGGLRSSYQGSNDNILYIDTQGIGREYSISVNASMNDGPGYGILFDTTGPANAENGYSLQFERYNGGRIIIRPRVNGRENPTSADFGENIENHYLYNSLTDSQKEALDNGNRVSPILYEYRLTDSQKESLESSNNLRMVVRDGSDSNRTIDVYLGDEKVIDGFEFMVADIDNPIDSSGLRVWENSGYHGSNVFFNSFEINNHE